MAALAAAGALPQAFPLIRLRPPDDRRPLEAALQDGGFDWAVFTSANAVRFCSEAAEVMGRRLGDCLGAARIACVGPATAAAARNAGLTVDVIPETYAADVVAPALLDAGMPPGARVLWPRSAQARRVLGDALVALGARLTDVVAYETEPDREQARALADALLQKTIDMVIFASPSTVNSLHAVLPGLPDVQVAVIGPATAAAARAAGYPVDILPHESTAAGVVAALQAHFA